MSAHSIFVGILSRFVPLLLISTALDASTQCNRVAIPSSLENRSLNWADCTAPVRTLQRKNISGSDFRWTRFANGSNLSDSDLSGSDLSWAQLPQVNMTRTVLSGSTLHSTNLQGANLTLANLSGSNLRGATLQNSNLDRANLQGAIIADMSTLKQGRNLARALWAQAEMGFADLAGVDFKRPLTNADKQHNQYFDYYHGAKPIVCEKKQGDAAQSKPGGQSPDIGGMTSGRAGGAVKKALGGALDKVLGGMGVPDMDSMGPDACTPFAGTWYWNHIKDAPPIPNMKYQEGAFMEGVNLNHASLLGTRFYEAHLSQANFSHADLRNANFTRGIGNKENRPEKINFDGANLAQADFSYADLRNSNLKGTNLEEVNFEYATLEGMQTDSKSRFKYLKLKYSSHQRYRGNMREIEKRQQSDAKREQGSRNQNRAEDETRSGAKLPIALPDKWQLVWVLHNLPRGRWQTFLDRKRSGSYRTSSENRTSLWISGCNPALTAAEADHAATFSIDMSCVDLTETDLSGLDLSRVNLSGADLTDVRLNNSDLRRSMFKRTKLVKGEFNEAKLGHAYLREADLSNATLDKAIFFNVDLYAAKLNGASLIETKLLNSNLKTASFGGADFGEIKEEWVVFPWYGSDFMKKGSQQKLDVGSILFQNPDWVSLPALLGSNLSGAKWLNGKTCKKYSIGKCKLDPPGF